MTITIDGTNGITPLGVSQNLTFTGTGNRITGDFSNATLANRVLFQTSTANSNTNVYAIPNGSGTASSFAAFNNSDVANASLLAIASLSSDTRLQSAITGTGTYLPMTFYTGGSERMRIDTSGNVGVGVTDMSVTGANAKFAVSAGGINLDDGYSLAWGGATTRPYVVGNKASSYIAIGTSGSERMRIDSSGNLLVGTTTPEAKVTIDAGSYNYGQMVVAKNGYFGIAVRNASGTSGWQAMAFFTGGSQVGGINCTSTATTYATSSDYRLKENIKPMQNALEFVRKQRPVTYNWKVDGSKGSGYIAHWMQEDGAGNCVTGEKDAVDKDGKPVYQGIDTSFMVAPLNAALNELADMVDTQKEIIAQLKAELDATKAEVAALKGAA